MSRSKLFLIAGIVIGVSISLGVIVRAQTPALTVKQGGTGWTGWVAGTIPIGPGTGTTALRFATSTGLTFATSTNRLSFTFGSSTAYSATNINATTFTGALVGNASTATALAGNGTNCSTGNYPLGVDASGNVEDCTAVSAGIAFPFTPTGYGNATSTTIGFTNGLLSSASSTFSAILRADAGISMNGWLLATSTVVCRSPEQCAFQADGTDDDATLQAAVNAIKGTGGDILIKCGDYNFTSTVSTGSVNKPWRIRGENKACTRISLSGNIAFFSHGGNDEGTELSNIYVDANDSTATTIQLATGTHNNTVIRDVHITQVDGLAIGHYGTNFLLDNVFLEDVENGFVSNTNSDGSARYGKIINSRITNVTHDVNDNEGIDLNWHGSQEAYAYLSNNYLSGFRQEALDLNTKFAEVIGNTISQPTYDGSTESGGILVQSSLASSTAIITGNIIRDVVGQGIHVGNNQHAGTISNNYIQGATTTQGRGYGIRLTGLATQNSIAISSNVLYDLKRGISNEITTSPDIAAIGNVFSSTTVKMHPENSGTLDQNLEVNATTTVLGLIRTLDSEVGTVAKFDSQGTTIGGDSNDNSILINGDSDDRPELAWFRGNRQYPEFSIRMNTNADTGAVFWTSNGQQNPAASLYIRESGRIGIGQASPSTAFQIGSTAMFATTTASSTFMGNATIQFASSTALSSPTICISTDCRTAWPSSTGSGLATTSPVSAGNLLVYTANGAGSAFGVATGTVSAGTGITLDDSTRSVIGGALQITNSSPLSGLSASYPFSFSNPTLTWLGLGTTTNSGMAAGNLYVGSGGIFQTAASSSIFGYTPVAPTRAINTTFPLQGGGTLSGDLTLTNAFSTTTNSGMAAGSLYVGSGGVFQSAASSSIFGYTPLNPTRQITVAGTAGQITSSAGAQDLSADRTWTLSLPNHVIFPTGYQASIGSTTNATSTNMTITGAVSLFGGAAVSTANALCVQLTGGAGLCDGTDATGSGSGVGTVATSSTPTQGHLSYWTSSGSWPETLSSIATTTQTFSGPFSLSATQGTLVGGSNATVAWTGLATTSQPSSSNLLVSNGGAGVFGVATTSVSCSGAASCTSFTAIGAAPITISATDSTASTTLLTDTNTFSASQQFNATSTILGLLRLLDSEVGTVAKFDSQGNAMGGTDVNDNSILLIGDSDDRPEIGWYRGNRQYPEFSMRANTTADTGLTMYAGGGVATPAAVMTFMHSGRVGIGTTTPSHALTIASTTAQHLGLSAGTGKDIWTLGNQGGNFHLATSSFTATSTASALYVGSDNIVRFGNNQATCIALTGSSELCDGDDEAGTGGGDFAWTPQSWGNSTSTTLGFEQGFMSMASSTITATTTMFAARFNMQQDVSSSESLGGVLNINRGTALGSGIVFHSAAGAGAGRGVSLLNTNTAYDTQLLHASSSSLTESTLNLFGIAGGKGVLKSTLRNGTNDSAAGSFEASGSQGQALFAKGNAGTTTPIFNVQDSGSNTAFKVDGNRLSTLINATSTHLTVSGSTWLTGITSAIPLTDSTGLVSEYAGTSCTNQVITALSALGAATCSNINNAYWSGTDLSVANGGTGLSTFGGTNTLLYTTAADTLASEAALTYDASLDRLTTLFASTTAISISGGLNITSDALGATARVSPLQTRSFSYATTTWNATTTLRIGPAQAGLTFQYAYCETNTGTVNVSLYDGTNRANLLNASTTIGKFSFSTNNAFTAGESIRIDAGTPASSPTNLACTLTYTYDQD